MITLDIIADPICPWCMIGKANLDRALEAAPNHPFVITWHPYQLNPETPAEGVSRREYLAEKFGADRLDAMDQQLQSQAKAAGIELDLSKITRIPNTLDAHRLIHWAGLEAKQTPVVSALMRAYWREGQDIGDHAVLAALAGQAGMDQAVVARLLASDADIEEIQTRVAHARARGVTGVPSFIIANQHVVTGAQPPELWAQVIAELTSQPSTEESSDT